MTSFFAMSGIFSQCVVADDPVFKVSSVVGINQQGDDADGSKASSAKIGKPVDVWLNPAGEQFIADNTYFVVRKVSTDGTFSRFAGTGSSTASGNGGKATSAGLTIRGMCGDTANSMMYFTSTSDHTVRRIQLSNNIITAFAGLGSAINDNGKATSAKLNTPFNCAVDTMGNVFIADKLNYLVRKVTISTNIITSVAGVAGSITFVADGAPATSSPLDAPQHIYLDSSATLYIFVYNHYRVRKMDLTSNNKALVTVIGNFCCTLY